MGLYNDLLRRLQDVNECGGGAATFLLRQPVFDEIDNGAANGDKTLIALRRELLKRASNWTNVEDHEARRKLFDTYGEATFFLASTKFVGLEGIPGDSSSTPDFQTLRKPNVRFEVKTLDIADPMNNYSRQMAEGREANIEANNEAQRKGIGFSEHVIAPHGSAQTWSEVIEQTMRKLGNNIKQGQYADEPTFLVANLGRLSVRVDSEQLDETCTIAASYTFEGVPADVSGHLWTIANHVPETAFRWLDLDERAHSAPIGQAGVLRDYPFLQGIIFTTEPWSEFERQQDWRDAYAFLGVWNKDCTLDFQPAATGEARRVLNAICMRIVDTR